jgi:3D-(3,5/4)-trihydroxycyclohexane-1,2-dione acylhydrolase (decyclizing)
VIDTSAERSTTAGGAWWDVPVAEVSESTAVQEARREYQGKLEESAPK